MRRTPPPGGAASASASASPSPPPGVFGGESDEENDDDRRRKARNEPAIPMTDDYRPMGHGSDGDKFKAEMVRLPDGMSNEAMVGLDMEAIAVRLLRGMTRRDGSSWNEGEALQDGGTVEALVAVPRRQGAGLGSDESQVLVAPGEKSRNYVSSSEKLVKKKCIEPGADVVVMGGVHEGVRARVLAFPSGYDPSGPPQPDAKLRVELTASGSEVTVAYRHLRLAGKDERVGAGVKRSAQALEDAGAPAKKKRRREPRPLEWVCRTGLLVRCIDHDVDSGRLYNQKVRVYDITSRTEFCIETPNGKIVEGVTEDQVETVIPRDEGAKLAIVRGSKRGNTATLLMRDKRREEDVCTPVMECVRLVSHRGQHPCRHTPQVQVRFEGSLTKKFTYSYYDVCAL